MEVDKAAAALAAAEDALGAWKQPLETLRAMDVPVETASALQQAEQTAAAAAELARASHQAAVAALDKLVLDEKHFTANHRVVTSSEVTVAREERDEAWQLIKRGAVTVEEGGVRLEPAIRLADELVDAQLASATDAVELQKLRQDIEAAGDETARLQRDLMAKEAQLAACRERIEKRLAEAGLGGMALSDLVSWRARREAVVLAHGALAQRQRELDAEVEAYGQACAAIATALGEAGIAFPADATLPVLVAIASQHINACDAARGTREELTRRLAQDRATLETLHVGLGRAQDALGAWQQQWQRALDAVGLSDRAGSQAEARAAVGLIEVIDASLKTAEDIRRTRIAPMREDLASVEVEARRLAEAIDTGLLGLASPMDVAQRLAARLADAKATEDARRHAEQALGEAATKQHEADLEVARVTASIEPLLSQAGATAIDDAQRVALQAERRRALEDEVGKALATLLAQGEGLSRQAIERELEGYDPAMATQGIQDTGEALDAINERLNELAQQHVTTRQAYELIDGKAKAAIAEGRRQEAQAAMAETAEQYLELAVATRLLKWAFDRYRDQKQGPMLLRAGAIFAQLTLGDFVGLVVNHDTDPPTLEARRANGKLIGVPGLSEGTVDQLFLALRLAALESHLQQAGALPFIADDLFVNFDDTRAAAGLRTLRDLSAQTQVIFLTHHEHLARLAGEVFGAELNVTRLARMSAVAGAVG